jgi:hypothetical protein
MAEAFRDKKLSKLFRIRRASTSGGTVRGDSRPPNGLQASYFLEEPVDLKRKLGPSVDDVSQIRPDLRVDPFLSRVTRTPLRNIALASVRTLRRNFLSAE